MRRYPQIILVRCRPVLSWLHPTKKTAIVRCSQPLAGYTGSFLSATMAPDEELLKAIMETNDPSSKLIIVDARGRVAAEYNRLVGGGFVSYEFCTTEFHGIENIHQVRDSWRSLHSLCHSAETSATLETTEPCKGQVEQHVQQVSDSWHGIHHLCHNVDNNDYFVDLGKTRWLSHCSAIMTAALYIADAIEGNLPTGGTPSTVVCHCSDGWDRTSQLVSLAMLLLDPCYRTVTGFEILIEKEWISFGHHFATRGGMTYQPQAHEYCASSEKERAPIFFQFLHIVWQLLRQFPMSFEFNEQMLVELADATHTWQWGTFLADTERERVLPPSQRGLDLPSTTASLWDYVNSPAEMARFRNPLYVLQTGTLRPNVGIMNMELWLEYVFRYERPKVAVHVKDDVGGALQQANVKLSSGTPTPVSTPSLTPALPGGPITAQQAARCFSSHSHSPSPVGALPPHSPSAPLPSSPLLPDYCGDATASALQLPASVASNTEQRVVLDGASIAHPHACVASFNVGFDTM
eukprot:TRINITY_DN23_c0_g1_i1.p1 TRINITY_DN23_c0_g1~~TRINITY_DN23_c0_g1_i1.p1  ORF type:complete len:520 (+),score=110.49 TRINITY_DN23_c0_g1_i1:1480-3039(+)